MSCKCTAYIIVCLISAFRKLLEFWNNQIIASLTFSKWTHVIMDFLTSVNTKNHIAHFFIGKFHHFIVQQYTVCCQCKTEFFIMDFFLTSAVCN